MVNGDIVYKAKVGPLAGHSFEVSYHKAYIGPDPILYTTDQEAYNVLGLCVQLYLSLMSAIIPLPCVRSTLYSSITSAPDLTHAALYKNIFLYKTVIS